LLQHGALESTMLVIMMCLLAVSISEAVLVSSCLQLRHVDDSSNRQDPCFAHVPLSRQQVKKLVGECRQHHPVLPP